MRGSSNFNFSKNNIEYIVSLNKTFRWWYLLPLLLLLLFIKCNQYTSFKVIDKESKTSISNASVVLSSSLFEQTNNYTDTNGLTKINIGKYPIYKLLFSKINNSEIYVNVSHPGYLTFDTLSLFKNIRNKTTIIELQNIPSIQITVIDSITRKTLQNILVKAQSVDTTSSQLSDNYGNTSFNFHNIQDNDEIVITTQSPDYEDVRKYYTFDFPKSIVDTITLLSYKDGGLKGLRGDITVNLAWQTIDDLDLMIIDPCNNRIYYKHKRENCSDGEGFLDLDANSNKDSLTNTPQENIFWKNPSQGNYRVFVYFYKKRTLNPVPFKVTLMIKDKKTIIDSVADNEKEIILIDTITIK